MHNLPQPGDEGRLIFISKDGTCVEADVYLSARSYDYPAGPRSFEWTFRSLGPVKYSEGYPSDAAIRILDSR